MLFTLLPAQALAAGTSKPSIDPAPANQTQKSEKAEGKIIEEITDKRDINIKHFRKDDLTFEADVFPFAVHYQKDGKWQDIDNTLVDGKDEENNDILENKDNAYKVKIAKNTSSSKLVQIQKDGYEVSWNLEGTQNILSQVKPKDQTALNVLSDNDKKRTLPNLSSTIDFMNIYPNIDLQYEVNPQDIKENIIIKEKMDNPLIIYNLNTKGPTHIPQPFTPGQGSLKKLGQPILTLCSLKKEPLPIGTTLLKMPALNSTQVFPCFGVPMELVMRMTLP